MPGSQKFSNNNFLRVFDICFELANDSEKYFRFVVDEVSELVHTIKSLCSLQFKKFYRIYRSTVSEQFNTPFLASETTDL